MFRQLLATTCILVLPAALRAQPTIEFGEEVTISGLTPSTPVAVFSSGRSMDGWTVARSHLAEVGQASGTGELAVAPEGGLDIQSVWLAVDLATGAYALGSPEGAEPTEMPFDLGLGLPGPDLLETEAPSLELYLARPTVGAWMTQASDGSPTDVGPSGDGLVRLNLAIAERVGATVPAYGAVQPGDVIFGLDMRNFSVFVVEVSQ